MWKKLQWAFWGVYVVAILALVVNSVRVSESHDLVSGLVSALVMLYPAGVLVYSLLGKKPHILFSLPAMLISALFLVGVFNFNAMSWETIGKALLFAPMLALLIYFAFRKRTA